MGVSILKLAVLSLILTQLLVVPFMYKAIGRISTGDPRGNTQRLLPTQEDLQNFIALLEIQLDVTNPLQYPPKTVGSDSVVTIQPAKTPPKEQIPTLIEPNNVLSKQEIENLALAQLRDKAINDRPQEGAVELGFRAADAPVTFSSKTTSQPSKFNNISYQKPLHLHSKLFFT
jgi:hypothetical protein